MKLIAKDQRHPVTVAFAFAISEKMADANKVALWRREMAALVEEITKKFVGFFARGSVRKGLDLVLGILSLPVADSTKGSYNSMVWALHLLEHGPKKLATLAIEMVRQVANGPAAELLVMESNAPVKELLLSFAKGYDYEDPDVWRGYKEYQGLVSKRRENMMLQRIVPWLLRETMKVDPVAWTRNETKKLLEAVPNADEIMCTILFRVCFGHKNWTELALERDELVLARKKYESNPRAWLKKARKRYDTLFAKIPREFRGALEWHGDWFDNHLGMEGPVEVSNKSWSDVINSPNFANIYIKPLKDQV